MEIFGTQKFPLSMIQGLKFFMSTHDLKVFRFLFLIWPLESDLVLGAVVLSALLLGSVAEENGAFPRN